MTKTLKKPLKIIFSILFIFIGTVLVLYIFSKPCSVDPVVTQQGEESAVTIFPKEVQRLLCIQGSAELLILTIVAVSSLFGGMSYLIKNLLGQS